MSFLRQTFLPAAAGIAVFTSAIGLPIAGSYALADAGVLSESDAPKLASLGALLGLFGGACAGQAVHDRTRRRLTTTPSPRSESEVVEYFLLNRLHGGIPLINISITVSARGDDFTVSLRNGPLAGNLPREDGTYPLNSGHGLLSRLGFDPAGVKLLGGGATHAYPHYAVVDRLQYDVKRESLPTALQRELRAFQTAQHAPMAVPYQNL